LFYRPGARSFELLDEPRCSWPEPLVTQIRGGGLTEGRVYWLDEVRDGYVWRVRGFTNEAAARAAHKGS